MADITQFLSTHIEMVYVLIFSIFVGIEVIGKVPSVLHTPLMSGANAIHGVVIIGSIIVMLNAETNNILLLSLGFVAVILGTLNVVGGFVVTDRMLEMFKKKPERDEQEREEVPLGASSEPEAQPPVRVSGPVEGVSGEPGGSPGAEHEP